MCCSFYHEEFSTRAQRHPGLLEPTRGNEAYLIEVEGRYRQKREQSPDVEALAQAIRQAVSESHKLRVYTVLLIKPSTIPKTSSGKIQRHVLQY